eukprot:contig_35010_g8407
MARLPWSLGGDQAGGGGWMADLDGGPVDPDDPRADAAYLAYYKAAGNPRLPKPIRSVAEY